MMTVGSLFSGIGGFDLGLERAGMRIEWQVENNDYCREVLKKHWPGVPCHYDIRTIGWEFVKRVDLICGGFPCQPFSCAGKQRGKDDDRYLWPEVVRCIAVLRPTWFIGENVYGILNLGIEQMYDDLEAIGYQVAILGIPACAVDAPHIRKRIWILAHAEGERRGEERSNCERPSEWSSCSCDVAHSENSNRRRASGETNRRGRHQKVRGCSRSGGWDWAAESSICRMAHGIPNRAHRLRGLGNAIVPQIAEAIGRMIVAVESSNGWVHLSGISPD